MSAENCLSECEVQDICESYLVDLDERLVLTQVDFLNEIVTYLRQIREPKQNLRQSARHQQEDSRKEVQVPKRALPSIMIDTEYINLEGVNTQKNLAHHAKIRSKNLSELHKCFQSVATTFLNYFVAYENCRKEKLYTSQGCRKQLDLHLKNVCEIYYKIIKSFQQILFQRLEKEDIEDLEARQFNEMLNSETEKQAKDYPNFEIELESDTPRLNFASTSKLSFTESKPAVCSTEATTEYAIGTLEEPIPSSSEANIKPFTSYINFE